MDERRYPSRTSSSSSKSSYSPYYTLEHNQNVELTQVKGERATPVSSETQKYLDIITALRNELEFLSSFSLVEDLRQCQESNCILTDELSRCQKSNLRLLDELSACQKANTILRDELERLEMSNKELSKKNRSFQKANYLLREELAQLKHSDQMNPRYIRTFMIKEKTKVLKVRSSSSDIYPNFNNSDGSIVSATDTNSLWDDTSDQLSLDSNTLQNEQFTTDKEPLSNEHDKGSRDSGNTTQTLPSAISSQPSFTATLPEQISPSSSSVKQGLSEYDFRSSSDSQVFDKNESALDSKFNISAEDEFSKGRNENELVLETNRNEKQNMVLPRIVVDSSECEDVGISRGQNGRHESIRMADSTAELFQNRVTNILSSIPLRGDHERKRFYQVSHARICH